MPTTEWPNPPIRPEHLPLIRALLTAEEYVALLKRLESDTTPPFLPTIRNPPSRTGEPLSAIADAPGWPVSPDCRTARRA